MSAMRMFARVLSHASIRTPIEPGFLFPTMFTSDMSQSDELLFAPCLMWRPRLTNFMETSRTFVSRPESMEMPFATPLPSMTPPVNE